MPVEPTSGFDLVTFLKEFGLPTAIVVYLLVVFRKAIDELTKTVNRLTGIIIALSHEGRLGDNDDP